MSIENPTNPDAPVTDAPQVSTFADAVAETTQDVPKVQQNAVDAHKQRQAAADAAPSDVKGEKFNPEKHAVDAQGNPKMTKTGRFSRKRSTRALNNPAAKQAEVDAKAISDAESEAAAKVVQDLKRNAYDRLLDYGVTDERHAMHIDATKAYFVEKGGVKLNPLHTLLVLEGAQMLELMGKPKTVSAIEKVKIWAYTRFKKKGKVKNGTHPSNRSNNVGQNNGGNRDAAPAPRPNQSPANRT